MRWVCVATMLLVGPAWASVKNYPFEGCFQLASRMHHVPLDLLLAVAATESNWDPAARSDANAHGIMQIQWPGTARHLGVRRVSELYNPCLNIELGARYLRELLDNNNGDEQRALAAYNYGPTRIARLTELPTGAKRYASTVQGHRARIHTRQATTAVERGGYGGEMRFANGLRARKFAESLGARVQNADFVTSRRADGTYSVSIDVAPDGLTVGDMQLLDQLGWPSAGSGARRKGG